MEKVVFTFILTVLLSNYSLSQNNGTPIYTINNGEIVTNGRFTDQIGNSVSGLNFQTTNISTVNVGSTNYGIKVGRFSGWQNEPGDLDVIQFFNGNSEVLTFKDDEGIVFMNNAKNLYANRFNNYSVDGLFFEIQMSPSSKALIFLGQHYGTNVAKLIIFVATSNQVKLVFCKKMAVNSMNNSSDAFSMTLQSNIVESGYGTPIIHTLWKQDGVLWFKNN